MEGVTTAIVLAIFAGIFWPHAIRNRSQFNFAIGAVLLIILLAGINGAVDAKPFARFAALAIGVLQVFGVFSIVLATSGQTIRELTGEHTDTIEVVRRGQEEKEIIIPRRGAGASPAPRRKDDDDARQRFDLGTIDDAGPAAAPRIPLRPGPGSPPPADAGPRGTSVPLE